jgi:hypothetical protein
MPIDSQSPGALEGESTRWCYNITAVEAHMAHLATTGQFVWCVFEREPDLRRRIVSIAAIAKAQENSRCPRGRHRWGTRTGSPASSVSLGKMLVNRKMYLELVDEHAGVEVVVNRARAARRRARRHCRAIRLHLVLQRAGLRGTVSAQLSLSKTRGAHVVGYAHW